MALIANRGGSFELAPQGTHVARCYRILDLGTQFSEFYQKSSHRILIGFELPTELMADGRPFTINKRYRLSFHENSTLRHDLEAWRGRVFEGDEALAFDVSKILGVPCLLNIIHSQRNDRTNADITSIMALPKGMVCPPIINPPLFLDLGDFNQAVFSQLSESLQETIRRSPEYQSLPGATPVAPRPASRQPAPLVPAMPMPTRRGEVARLPSQAPAAMAPSPPDFDDDLPWPED